MLDSYKECVIKLLVIYLIGNLLYFIIYKIKKSLLYLLLIYFIIFIY